MQTSWSHCFYYPTMERHSSKTPQLRVLCSVGNGRWCSIVCSIIHLKGMTPPPPNSSRIMDKTGGTVSCNAIKTAIKSGQLSSLYLFQKCRTLFPLSKCNRKKVNIKIIFHPFKAFKWMISNILGRKNKGNILSVCIQQRGTSLTTIYSKDRKTNLLSFPRM